MGERGANTPSPSRAGGSPASTGSTGRSPPSTRVTPSVTDSPPGAENVGVLPGRRIGRYKLLFPIGAGGMAQVWAARPDNAALARTVAIKLVLPDYSADPEYE